MARLEQRQLIEQAGFALAQGVDPTAHRRDPLADVQIQPLHKRGIDLPATRPQDLLDPFHGAKHHTVCHARDTPTPVRLHDLRLQQLGKRYPAGGRPHSFGVVPLRLPPRAKVGQQGGAVLLEAIGQQQRDTARCSHPHDLMHHALSQGQGAGADINHQQQCALGVHRCPYPVGRAPEALDRLVLAALTVFDVPQHSIQLIELSLLDVHITEELT